MQKLSGIYTLTTKKKAYYIEVRTDKPAHPEFVSRTTSDYTEHKNVPLLGSKVERAENMKKDRSQSEENKTRPE